LRSSVFCAKEQTYPGGTMPRFLIPLLLSLYAPVALADDYIMLKVNGDEISAETVQKSWSGLFPETSAPAFETVNPAIQQNVLRGVVTQELLLNEATSQGIENTEAFKKLLEEAKQKLLVRQLLDVRGGALLNDAAIDNAYAKYVQAQKGKNEIRASHILVESKKKAKEVAKKLEDGGSFEALAKEFSKDPGSAEQGGDLGYFTADKMVKEFADAAFALDKGEVSKPVKSPFGWHIIQVEDIRPVTITPLNDMREELRNQLRERALNSYVQGLLDKAKIVMFDAKGNEIPFEKKPKSLPATSE
jgi:peptidyl-prolyl cis-trans isomerase C